MASATNQSSLSAAPIPHSDLPAVLNIAATCLATRVLGPGLRSVVWVQGCPFHCQDCISPQWIPIRPNILITPRELAPGLLSHPDVSGLTISGGEPFLQAKQLAELIRIIRNERNLNVICYTGFLLGQLSKMPVGSGVSDLLSQIDVLIDGPYIASQNDNRGLRGSSNQTIHHLTTRINEVDFENQPRQAEIYVRNGSVWVVGVPPIGVGFNILNGIRKAEKDVRTQAHHSVYL